MKLDLFPVVLVVDDDRGQVALVTSFLQKAGFRVVSAASAEDAADTNAMFLERLLAAPNRTLDLLPGGQAHAEQLTTLAVGAGAGRQTITAWSITGLSNSPITMWSDASGRFFGTNAGLAWLPEGYEDALKPTEKAQNDALAATTAALGARLARTAAAPIAITNVRTFDADGGRFLDGQTVVVDKGIITAVGPVGPRHACRRTPSASTARARRSCRGCGTATCTSATTSPACRSCRWA